MEKAGLNLTRCHSYAQCSEFVNGTACEDYLANAISNISSCTPKEEGRVLNSGCYLRHSIEEFYYNSTQPIRNNNQGEFGSNEFFHFCSVFPSGVASGWVWGGHNWVGHIKPIYPFKTHLTNCF